MKYKNKKGQIEQLQGLILALIIVGVVLVVGFLIFEQTKDQVVDLISSATATNESFAYVNYTQTALAYSPGSVTLSCTALYNDTLNAVPISVNNYTCNTSGIYVSNPGGALLITEAQTLWVTYTYKMSDYAYNATNEVQNATQDIPGWLPIIVVVVIGALLIGLVSFLRGQAR